jgi:PII-like signaling protein
MATWSEAMSLQVLISEDDSEGHRPLHEVILRAARDADLAGAKVIRGTVGYGRSGHIHEIWRGFSYDLPVVVEVIDNADKIDAFVPTLQRLRQGALVIRQRVEILEPCGPSAG